MVWQLITAAFAGADLLTGWMDARITNKGIKAGIAVEGNGLLVKLAGTNKPSLIKLVVYNVAKLSLWVGVGLVFAYHFPSTTTTSPVYLGRVLMPVFAAIDATKHYQGFRQWAWMFRNPGKRVEDQENTAWQKFIGFWG
jgi:hypothetical protein